MIHELPTVTARDKFVQHNSFLIVDDFLTGAAWEEIATWAAQSPYSFVHRNEWRRVWRLNDGNPLQGSTIWSNSADLPAAVRPFVDALAPVIEAAAPLIGTFGRDWQRYSFAPWVYPAGTALSLHQDSVRYSGSYVYYLHPTWDVHWGGHLMIFDSPPAHDRSTAERAAQTYQQDAGLATCVLARPNRLVLIAPEAAHLVTRVDETAGDRHRLSCAGFFHRE